MFHEKIVFKLLVIARDCTPKFENNRFTIKRETENNIYFATFQN